MLLCFIFNLTVCFTLILAVEKIDLVLRCIKCKLNLLSMKKSKILLKALEKVFSILKHLSFGRVRLDYLGQGIQEWIK